MPTPIPSMPTDATLAGLEPRETTLSSQGLKVSWDERLKEQSLFSARTTCRSYLDMVKKRLVEVATRAVIPSDAERMLRKTLEDIGYSPETGFPDARGRVPPAKPGSITDLSSSRRIQLILDTNVKQARSLGQVASSENPIFLMTNPAWRLTRTGARRKPRGDWKKRWAAAGAACGWKGALQRDMVALKTSPIWAQIGRGAGGFLDTIGTDYPPFAFGSGLAWVNVGRREWRRLCTAEGVPDGLEDVNRVALATKAAQEAAGGKGAYGTRAKPGAAEGFARGLIEGLVRGTGGAFSPNTRQKDAAQRAVTAAIAEADAALRELRDGIESVEAYSRRSALEDGAAEVVETAKKASAELSASEKTVAAVRTRLAAYLRSVESASLPKDAAAQGAFDVKMARLKDAAEKSKKILIGVRKTAKKRVAAMARLAEEA